MEVRWRIGDGVADPWRCSWHPWDQRAALAMLDCPRRWPVLGTVPVVPVDQLAIPGPVGGTKQGRRARLSGEERPRARRDYGSVGLGAADSPVGRSGRDSTGGRRWCHRVCTWLGRWHLGTWPAGWSRRV